MSKEVFTIDTKDADMLVSMLKEYPKQLKAASYRLVNDMRWEYIQQGPGVIDRHYAVRNMAFVKSAFGGEKAQTANTIDDIFSIAGTYGPDSGKERFKNFTGWEEVIDPSLKSGRERIIGSKARGGEMSGRVKKQYRMNPGEIPSAKNFNGRYRAGKKNLSFMAMLYKQNYRGTFILEKEDANGKGTVEAGLYTFTDKYEEGWLFPRIMRLQKFGVEPKGKSFDWNEEILELVRKKFTTQTIFDKYILPALEKAQKTAR